MLPYMSCLGVSIASKFIIILLSELINSCLHLNYVIPEGFYLGFKVWGVGAGFTSSIALANSLSLIACCEICSSELHVSVDHVAAMLS